MSIAAKLTCTVLLIVLGTVIFGLVRDIIGHGQFIISALMVYGIYLIWTSKSKEGNP